MLRLVTIFAAIALTALPVHAASHRATFAVPAGARVQVAALADGFTVGVHVDGLESRALERALLRLRSEKVQVLSSRGKKSMAYVQFADRVMAADARLGKTTRQRAVQVHLHISTELPRDALLAHVMDQALPVPKTLETDALARADAAFVAKRLAESELLLAQLKDSGLQRAWVMLRTGDLAVFHDRTEQACSAYNEAQADGGMRTASTLAALRARVLGCHRGKKGRLFVNDQAMATTEAVDWALLLRRTGRDDPIGRLVAQEARWALNFERDPQVLADVIDLTGPAYVQTLDKMLRDALLARLLRRSSPFALATRYRRGVGLAAHAEAFDLALSFGLAWCALDAPSGWSPPPKQSKSWMRLAQAERGRLIQEVSACSITTPGATTPLAFDVHNTKPGAHLLALQRRLEVVQRALTQRQQSNVASVASNTAP